MAGAEPGAPSPWLLRHVGALRAAARLGPVADLACGRGRHSVALAARGIRVAGLDRSRERLRELRRHAAAAAAAAECIPQIVCADLETHGIPFRPGSCGAILVFRFLFRPLAPAIRPCLAPGGLLLYETFTKAQRELGWGPRNPDYLLAPGELPGLFPGLEVIETWEGISPGPRPAALAQLLARRPARP